MGTGSACVFPFRHEGVVYNQCTEVAVSGVTGSQAWCSTNITTAGEHIAGSEAVCPNTCDGAQNNTATATTTTTASTTTTTAAVNTNSNRVRSNCVTVSGPSAGNTCVFPFIFQGVSYNGCADWVYGGENSGQSWCSTKTDDSENTRT